jgi:hypothetical protein
VAYLLLVLVVPLVVLTIWSARRLEPPRHDDAPRHAWAVARASSADGVLARLEADVTFRVLEAGVRSPAHQAGVVAEEALRRAIVSSRVPSLPGVGDEVPVGTDVRRPGIAVDSVVVTASDVEVTGELRRLVGGT